MVDLELKGMNFAWGQPASVPKKPTKGGDSELKGTNLAWG